MPSHLPMSARRKMRRRSGASAQMLEIVHGRVEQPWHARLSRETRDALPGLHVVGVVIHLWGMISISSGSANSTSFEDVRFAAASSG